MQRRTDAHARSRAGLGAVRPGRPVAARRYAGLWTFNEDPVCGPVPVADVVAASAAGTLPQRTLTFLKAQKYEKQASFDKVLPGLGSCHRGLRTHHGDSDFQRGRKCSRARPLTSRINEYYQRWHDQQQKARMPFVTVLRARTATWPIIPSTRPPGRCKCRVRPRRRKPRRPSEQRLQEALQKGQTTVCAAADRFREEAAAGKRSRAEAGAGSG